MTPRRKPLPPTPKHRKRKLRARVKAAISNHWKRYTLTATLALASLPDVWLTALDYVSNLDMPADAVPPWIRYSLRAAAGVAFVSHHLKQANPPSSP